ncbi:zinc finger CCCH domain-containing protein 44-like [Impatiens glandulifera]|uniref:zinc finger CCCH domain-containing protein 44-like n=1 Tax=Impatiens glandulifera TaxID=253017 RepID=UPI001FB0F866|nr:zinc finger CCCH domain-containing protein 44-like [Impatiens glandulifera]
MKRNTLDMRKKKNQEVGKKEIAEDWCFVCKDGGSLRVCDYNFGSLSGEREKHDCNLVYWLQRERKSCNEISMQQFPIVGVAVSIMELQLFSFFILTRWHSCFNCNKPSKYHCFFCPSAVCQHCSNILEFARVRDTKGFCHNCLKLALLGEANKTEDSDEEFVDFSNRDTFECLFLEYWLIIN